MISGIGIGPLLIILLLVVLLFGTKKLRGMGSDLGGAIKNFKKSINGDDNRDDNKEHGVPDQQKIEHKETK